jgi:hypothetical protein
MEATAERSDAPEFLQTSANSGGASSPGQNATAKRIGEEKRYAWRADDAYGDLAKGMELIHKARLIHISPTADGAFPGTSISAGYGSLESIAKAAAAARNRQLDLAQARGMRNRCSRQPSIV